MSNKVGRNEPCPCGSGKKYKKCCIDLEESRKSKKMDFAEAQRRFIEMKRKDFILEPYIECPKCHKSTYGVQMDFSDGHHYVRGCIDCRHREKIVLPEIQKEVVYLDQNIISEMTKVLDVKSPGYARIKAAPHYAFWVEVWNTLNRLVKKQLIICPDSFFHRHESVVDRRHKKLVEVYEKLSHGITFQPDDVIQRIQSNHYLKRYLGIVKEEISFDPQTVVTGGQINDWHNNFHIGVAPIVMPNEPENLRVSREKAYDYLKGIYPSWQTTERSFEQLVLDEGLAFVKAQLSVIDQYLQIRHKILSGEVKPDMYNMIPPFALDWLTATREIMESVTSDPEEQKEIINSFFRGEKILTVPSILISSLLYASVAMAAKNGAKIPTRGVFNDVQCISAYLPYCDVMFVDNENANYLAMPRVASRIGKFGTKIFSLSTKEEFLDYLKKIEENADPKHIAAAKDFYRTDFAEKEDISDNFFREDDEDA